MNTEEAFSQRLGAFSPYSQIWSKQKQREKQERLAQYRLANQICEPFRCIVCNMQTDKCCSRCNTVFYCSAEHQKFNWKAHRPYCDQYVRQQ